MTPIPVPLSCINNAAIHYHIPAKLIISFLEIEQGKVGQIVKNKNGTYDIGPMQINSSWLSTLNKYGISESDIKNTPCMNVEVGTWIAAQKIAQENDLLVGIGDYNSHTRSLNKKYSLKVRIALTKLAILLNNAQK